MHDNEYRIVIPEHDSGDIHRLIPRARSHGAARGSHGAARAADSDPPRRPAVGPAALRPTTGPERAITQRPDRPAGTPPRPPPRPKTQARRANRTNSRPERATHRTHRQTTQRAERTGRRAKCAVTERANSAIGGAEYTNSAIGTECVDERAKWAKYAKCSVRSANSANRRADCAVGWWANGAVAERADAPVA